MKTSLPTEDFRVVSGGRCRCTRRSCLRHGAAW